jgi:hypothetical protein
MRTLKILMVMMLLTTSVTIIAGFSMGKASDDLTISPDNILLELVAGGFTQGNLTITWSGNKPTIVFFQTKITPSSEGINVTYNGWKNYVFIRPGENIVDMKITTVLNLKPQKYLITTNVFSTIQTKTITDTETKTITVYITDESTIEALHEQLEDLQNQLDEQDDACSATIQELEQKIKELEDMIKMLEDYIERGMDSYPDVGGGGLLNFFAGIMSIAYSHSISWFPVWLAALALVALIFVVILVGWRYKKKKRKEK